jgi:hypothetical protein
MLLSPDDQKMTYDLRPGGYVLPTLNPRLQDEDDEDDELGDDEDDDFGDLDEDDDLDDDDLDEDDDLDDDDLDEDDLDEGR